MLAYEYQSDGSLKIVEKDTPTAGEGELVVEVAAAGICGTDLKIARGEHRMHSPGTVRVRGYEATRMFALLSRTVVDKTGSMLVPPVLRSAPTKHPGLCIPTTLIPSSLHTKPLTTPRAPLPSTTSIPHKAAPLDSR